MEILCVHSFSVPVKHIANTNLIQKQQKSQAHSHTHPLCTDLRHTRTHTSYKHALSRKPQKGQNKTHTGEESTTNHLQLQSRPDSSQQPATNTNTMGHAHITQEHGSVEARMTHWSSARACVKTHTHVHATASFCHYSLQCKCKQGNVWSINVEPGWVTIFPGRRQPCSHTHKADFSTNMYLWLQVVCCMHNTFTTWERNTHPRSHTPLGQSPTLQPLQSIILPSWPSHHRSPQAHPLTHKHTRALISYTISHRPAL